MTEEEVFQQARQIANPIDRQAFLTNACSDDPKRLVRLIKLLDVDLKQPGFLETPALAFAETMVQRLSESVGQVIDKYELLELIGEGGFGLVFKAQQLRPVQRLVAVKLIKPGMDSQQVVARFSLEQQALARMNHPQIAAIFDCGQTASGRLWFAMEFVPGQSITQFADQRRLSLTDRIRLLIDVCSAVEHAHQKGIIHRDLKPSNILVVADGNRWQLKVIDFGIARAIDNSSSDHTRLTRGAQLMGTPLYMSPEQTSGDSSDIDTRADIYSLGSVLYELITGSTPFERLTASGTSWDQILHEIRQVDPQRLSAWLASDSSRATASAERLRTSAARLVADCRRDLDWIAMKCLEKDRSRRYRSVSDLREDLDRYLDGDVVQAGPPTILTQWRKYWKRNQRAIVFVGTVMACLIVGLIASLSQAYRASRAEVQAKQDRDNERAARREADQQSEISQAVTQFLTEELLQQADVANQVDSSTRNPEITVREILLRAASRITDRFESKPYVEVVIRDTLSNSLWGIGAFQEALQQAQACEKIAKLHLDENDPRRLRAQHTLAMILADTEQPAAAIEILERLETHYRQTVGPEHSNTLRIRQTLAKALESAGRLAEAERHVIDVFTICENRTSPDHGETLNARYNLACLWSKMGRAAKAESLFRQIVETRSAAQGDSHPLTIKATHALALNLHFQGKRAEAEPIYQQAVSLAKQYLGDDHLETLAILNDLGNLYAETDRPDEARQIYENVLKIRKQKLGERNPATWDSMNNLAIHYAEEGDVELAIELLQEVVALRKQFRGLGHPDTLQALNNLAYFHQSLDQFSLAVELYAEAWTHAKSELKPSHPVAITLATNYANSLAQMSEWERCAAVMRENLPATRQHHGEQSVEHASQLGRLALILIEMNQWSEAESLAQQAWGIRQAVAPQHWPTGWAQSLVGRIQYHQGQVEIGLTNLVAGAEAVSSMWDQVGKIGRGNAVQAFDWLIEVYEKKQQSDDVKKWSELKEKYLDQSPNK